MSVWLCLDRTVCAPPALACRSHDEQMKMTGPSDSRLVDVLLTRSAASLEEDPICPERPLREARKQDSPYSRCSPRERQFSARVRKQ